MDEKRAESGGVKSAKALHLQTQKTAGGASHVANIAISDTTDTATSDTDGGLAVAMVVINKGEADVGLTLPGYRNSTGGANVESDFEEKGSSGDPGGKNKKDQVRPYSRSKCAQSWQPMFSSTARPFPCLCLCGAPSSSRRCARQSGNPRSLPQFSSSLTYDKELLASIHFCASSTNTTQ